MYVRINVFSDHLNIRMSADRYGDREITNLHIMPFSSKVSVWHIRPAIYYTQYICMVANLP